MKNIILLLCFALWTHVSTAQWTATSEPVPFFPAVSVESINNKLYAATNNGLYSSSDNGSSWDNLVESGGFKQVVQISGDTLVATWYGMSQVMISYDNGDNWQFDTVGISGKGENKAVYYDVNSNHILLSLGYPTYGLFYKAPADGQWTKVSSTDIGTNAFTNVSHLTGRGNKIFAAGYKSFYESTDGGISWTKITTNGYPNTTDAAHAKAPFISTPTALYLTGEGGIYKSTDDGVNWTKTGTGITNFFFGNPFATTMFYDGTKIYIGTRGHNDSNFVYTSTDEGVSWQQYHGILPSWPVSITKHNGAIFITLFNNSKAYHDGGFSTGLSSQMSPEIAVYPVPAKDLLNIEIPVTSGDKKMNLYNSNGQCVLETTSEDAVTQLQLSLLPAGVYMLQVRVGNEILNKRVVIAH